MSFVHRKRGQQIDISEGLCLLVLEINARGIKFGLSDTASRNTNGVLSRQMAEVCRNGACYFWFSKDHSCILVLWCEKGKFLSLTDDRRLTVVDVCAEYVTLAITDRPATGSPSNNGGQYGRPDFAAAHPRPAVEPMTLSGDTWVVQPVPAP